MDTNTKDKVSNSLETISQRVVVEKEEKKLDE